MTDSNHKTCGRCKHGNDPMLCGKCEDEYEQARRLPAQTKENEMSELLGCPFCGTKAPGAA